MRGRRGAEAGGGGLLCVVPARIVLLLIVLVLIVLTHMCCCAVVLVLVRVGFVIWGPALPCPGPGLSVDQEGHRATVSRGEATLVGGM